MSPNTVASIKKEREDRRKETSKQWHAKFESKGVAWMFDTFFVLNRFCQMLQHNAKEIVQKHFPDF